VATSGRLYPLLGHKVVNLVSVRIVPGNRITRAVFQPAIPLITRCEQTVDREIPLLLDLELRQDLL
jgi:hypothetical protein